MLASCPAQGSCLPDSTPLEATNAQETHDLGSRQRADGVGRTGAGITAAADRRKPRAAADAAPAEARSSSRRRARISGRSRSSKAPTWSARTTQRSATSSTSCSTSSGKIEAFIVGVGGFLGIGEKNVAIDMSAFQVVPPAPAAPQVAQAPRWQRRSDRRQAQGVVDQGRAQGGAGLRVLQAAARRRQAPGGSPTTGMAPRPQTPPMRRVSNAVGVTGTVTRPRVERSGPVQRRPGPLRSFAQARGEIHRSFRYAASAAAAPRRAEAQQWPRIHAARNESSPRLFGVILSAHHASARRIPYRVVYRLCERVCRVWSCSCPIAPNSCVVAEVVPSPNHGERKGGARPT